MILLLYGFCLLTLGFFSAPSSPVQARVPVYLLIPPFFLTPAVVSLHVRHHVPDRSAPAGSTCSPLCCDPTRTAPGPRPISSNCSPVCCDPTFEAQLGMMEAQLGVLSLIEAEAAIPVIAYLDPATGAYGRRLL
ncbi:hypothetical protein LINGRAHAP2_LOCUS3587 [Linum grandiflorum]